MGMIGVYVNDIILAGKSDKRMKEVEEDLAKKFNIKDMGKLHHFLGKKIIQPVGTPVDSMKLVKAAEDDKQIVNSCINQQLEV